MGALRTRGAGHHDVGDALAEGGFCAGVLLRRSRRHARRRWRIHVRPQPHLPGAENDGEEFVWQCHFGTSMRGVRLLLDVVTNAGKAAPRVVVKQDAGAIALCTLFLLKPSGASILQLHQQMHCTHDVLRFGG